MVLYLFIVNAIQNKIQFQLQYGVYLKSSGQFMTVAAEGRFVPYARR